MADYAWIESETEEYMLLYIDPQNGKRRSKSFDTESDAQSFINGDWESGSSSEGDSKDDSKDDTIEVYKLYKHVQSKDDWIEDWCEKKNKNAYQYSYTGIDTKKYDVGDTVYIYGWEIYGDRKSAETEREKTGGKNQVYELTISGQRPK